MFTELLLGCLSSGHRNLSMFQVSSSTVFFFVSHMHIHVPFIMYCSRLFVVVFQEKIASSLYQVSGLSVLQLVRYGSRGRTRRRRRRILKLAISNFYHLSWAYSLPTF